MAYISQDEKKALAPAIKAVLKKYDMKGTISIRDRMMLVVTLKSGSIDFSDVDHAIHSTSVNRLEQGVKRAFLNDLFNAMKGSDYFDESDIITDYFHCSHYVLVNVGNGYFKPFVYVENNIPLDLRIDPTQPAYIIQTV